MRHVKHIHSPRISGLTWHLETLHDLFRILPNLEQTFWDSIRTANLERGIKDADFRFKKRRILIVHYLLKNNKGLNRGQIQTVADTVLNCQDMHSIQVGVLRLLKVAEKDKGSTRGRFIASADGHITGKPPISSISKLTTEEALCQWRDANNFSLLVPDSRFLSSFKKTEPIDECLRDAINAAEEIAYAYLRKLIEPLVDELGKQISTIQKGEWDKQLQREITSEEKELGILRFEFVQQVEVLSRERSRS